MVASTPAPKGALTPVFSATFDPASLMCDPSELGRVLQEWVNDSCAYSIPEGQRPPLADTTGWHRLLIRASKPRYSYSAYRARLTLQQLRPHTDLYTPRTCYCLYGAWRRFLEELDAGLKMLPTATYQVWADGRPAADLHGKIDDRTVAQFGDITVYGTLRELNFRYRRAPSLYVSASTDANGLAVLTCRVGTGRRLKTVVAQQLDERRSALVQLLSVTSDADHPAAHLVAGWSEQFVDVVLAHPSCRSDALYPLRVQPVRQWIAALEEAGFHELGEVGRRAAAQLAPGWTGTAADLVRSAAAVAA